MQQINITSTMVVSENKTNFSNNNIIDDVNNNENNESITNEHSNISIDNTPKSMLNKTYLNESSDVNNMTIVNSRINEKVISINILRDDKTPITNLSKDKKLAAINKKEILTTRDKDDENIRNKNCSRLQAVDNDINKKENNLKSFDVGNIGNLINLMTTPLYILLSIYQQ